MGKRVLLFYFLGIAFLFSVASIQQLRGEPPTRLNADGLPFCQSVQRCQAVQTKPGDSSADEARCETGRAPTGRETVVPRAKEVEKKVRVLLEAENLDGWEVVKENVFDRAGKVSVEKGSVILEQGNPATGIRWKGEMPRSNYELQLEGKRLEGSDFFCGLTFPVGDEYCTFIIGGWGGGTTGLSNIDDLAAVENETTDFINFQQDKWYAIRLRVTDERITAWIDDKQMLDVSRTDKKFSIWWEQEPLRPLGIATWHTKSAIRKLRLKEL